MREKERGLIRFFRVKILRATVDDCRGNSVPPIEKCIDVAMDYLNKLSVRISVFGDVAGCWWHIVRRSGLGMTTRASGIQRLLLINRYMLFFTQDDLQIQLRLSQ